MLFLQQPYTFLNCITSAWNIVFNFRRPAECSLGFDLTIPTLMVYLGKIHQVFQQILWHFHIGKLALRIVFKIKIKVIQKYLASVVNEMVT